jgi:hypothetical protein
VEKYRTRKLCSFLSVLCTIRVVLRNRAPRNEERSEAEKKRKKGKPREKRNNVEKRVGYQKIL